MTKPIVVTARLDEKTAAELDRLASHLDRSRAWIVQRAVERYVEQESDFIAFVQVGIDAADRGELISQEDMEAWFEDRARFPVAAE